MRRTIDRQFIQRKLELIAEELGRLLELKSLTFEELTDDFVKLAAVERILERIVNRAIDINQHIIARAATGAERQTTRLSYRDTFLLLADLQVFSREFSERIATSAGLRNMLVHEYSDVDRRLVYGSIRTCIEDYRAYIESIRRYVDTLQQP